MKKYWLWRVIFNFETRHHNGSNYPDVRKEMAEVFVSTKGDSLPSDETIRQAMFRISTNCPELRGISKLELVGPVYVDLPEL